MHLWSHQGAFEELSHIILRKDLRERLGDGATLKGVKIKALNNILPRSLDDICLFALSKV